MSNIRLVDDLQFYVLFNSYPVKSGRYEGEMLCAMKCLRLKRFPPLAGIESGP